MSRLYQVVEIEGETAGRVNNVVDFSPRGIIAIEADLEDRPQPNRLGFRFTGGRVLLRTLWNGTLSFPYPVPFELLGDNARQLAERSLLVATQLGSLVSSDGFDGCLAALRNLRGAPEPLRLLRFPP